MNNLNHLLTKNGILTSFNICKKFSNSKIRYIKNKLLKSGIPKEKLEDEVYKYIANKESDETDIENIPGIILDGVPSKIRINPTVQKKIAVTSKSIADYLKKNKFTKEETIFFIQAVFLLCGINNDDVQKFKQKYNIDNELSDDYLDEDEDDDESGFE